IGADWLNTENNSSVERNSTGTTLNSQTSINYIPIKNKRHTLTTMVLVEINQDKDEFIETSTGNGPSAVITDPASSPLRRNIKSGASVVNRVGVLTNIHYKFLDRHIFQINMRNDASSRFGENSRWGAFPSASYAWRFSDEPFLSYLSFIEDSKLRVSYGLSGNSNVRAYDRHGLYDSNGSGQYMDISTIVPTQVQLQKLQWETSTQLNLGLDISLFDYRLTFNAEYYDKITDNILWKNYKLPSSSGYDKLRQFNDGKIQNTGYEISTRIVAIKKKDFTLGFNFNIYFNENKFLEFPSNIIDEETDISNGNYPVKAELGKPVGSFFGFKYLGVYPTAEDAVAKNEDGTVKLGPYGNPIPMNYNGTYEFTGGDAKYKDVNYDGIIDLDDVIYLGNSNPDFAGGFGMNISYKGFKFRSNFLYRYGYKVVNEIALKAESMSNKNNQSKAVLNRWRVSGNDFPNMLPRAYRNHPANNLGSDRYVEDASFIRLNNISLNYTFNDRFVQSLGLKDLRVGVQVRKLLTFTNYSGQDPEVRLSQDDALWFARDKGKVPSPIITAFNVAVSF
ncbi:MAG TPA: hypothetical protein VJ951_04630, partial [Bacteroidales bacterium]|nr:hypothetical protein [Bacteroidales bacterium]